MEVVLIISVHEKNKEEGGGCLVWEPAVYGRGDYDYGGGGLYSGR